MPQKQSPTDGEILEGVNRLGSVAAFAREINFATSTLKDRINRKPDLKKKIAKARRLALARPGKTEVSEEEILKQRTRELEAKLRRHSVDDVYQERHVRRLEEAISSVKPRYSPLTIPKQNHKDEHEFVLLFSDTHAGESVDRESTLGMNEYNWEIMLKRMAKLQRSVLSYQANRPYPIKKLHVAELGDMLSGDIHDELKITNEMSMEEATVQFGVDNACWLEGFVPHFKEIDVVGVPGNHPRKTQKPSMKQAQNNSDWTAYNISKLYLRHYDCFNWNIPNSNFALTTVADRWRMLLMHGDGIRSTMPGVPWGGVVRRITTLEQQFLKAKQPIDYVALGHFHTANSLDGVGVKTFLNGSVKGLDEYSLKQFGSGRPPSQLLLTFHPRKGITDVSFIDLEEQQPAAHGFGG